MNTTPQYDTPWIIDASMDTFQDQVFEQSHSLPVVVDFWTHNCQPCQTLMPILEALAKEYDGRFLLVKANAEQLQQAAMAFGVQGVPAVYAVSGGEIVDFFQGAMPEAQVREWIDRQLPSEADELTAAAQARLETDAEQAESNLRRALELDASHAAARLTLAQLLLNLDRVADCRSEIEHLEGRGFLEPEGEKIKAALEIRASGNQIGSIEVCRQNLLDDPNNRQLRLELGQALAAAGNYQEALDVLLAIVQEDKTGDGDTAREKMIEIFRLLPDDSELTTDYRRQLSLALY